MSEPIVRMVGVERRYLVGESSIQALRGVDLCIARRQFLAISGPSGSGKSTLLNMIGLLDRPDSGSVYIEGVDTKNLSDDELSDCRNLTIGFVFQNFNLIPVLSALHNVSLPLQIRGQRIQDAVLEAEGWLERVGLADFKNHRPDHLSGGQRQRVAIARALVGQPHLLIADEPTANLDSKNANAVLDLLEQVTQETGTTCVFSTHDPRLLARVPLQLTMEDGALFESRAVA